MLYTLNSTDKVLATLVSLPSNDSRGLKDDVSELYFKMCPQDYSSNVIFIIPDWHQFVTNKLWLWEQTNLSWAKDFPGRLKIVFYDDLVSNTDETLRDILQFIGHKVDEDLLKCTLSRKEGIYRRRKRIQRFDPYTKEMHEKISEKTKEVFEKLGRT